MANVTGGSGELNSDETPGNRAGQYLVYFAAERTLMAWIRAALAFMALGFVIDRFGLVVLTVTPHAEMSVHTSTLSLLSGAGLVAIGALMAIVAAVRYTHFVWRYRQTGDIEPGYGLEPAILFTVAVGLGGAVIAGYLMAVSP